VKTHTNTQNNLQNNGNNFGFLVGYFLLILENQGLKKIIFLVLQTTCTVLYATVASSTVLHVHP
jgi:hypothetical protein